MEADTGDLDVLAALDAEMETHLTRQHRCERMRDRAAVTIAGGCWCCPRSGGVGCPACDPPALISLCDAGARGEVDGQMPRGHEAQGGS